MKSGICHSWLSLLLILLAGCSNNTGPVAGALAVTLTSPRQDDGAVLFMVYGGPVDSIESVGYPIYLARAADTVKVIITGSVGPGPIARVHIPDSRQASRYGSRIGQVAERRTYVQRDPAGYAVSLIP